MPLIDLRGEDIIIRVRIFLVSIIVALNLYNCNQISGDTKTHFSADNSKIHYSGRIDFSNTKKPILSGPGSYIKFQFKGTSCEIFIRDEHLYGQRNYISIELHNRELAVKDWKCADKEVLKEKTKEDLVPK